MVANRDKKQEVKMDDYIMWGVIVPCLCTLVVLMLISPTIRKEVKSYFDLDKR